MHSEYTARENDAWKIYTKIHYKTRQNSTQSIGNMPPPPPRHWLPHVLKIMPRNPKYDQFQSKGHHNEENSQSMTKIPKFDPFHEVKIVPSAKIRKIKIRAHNLLSSEDAQDTSACKIPGHFLQWVLREMPGNPKFDPFHYVKKHQN